MILKNSGDIGRQEAKDGLYRRDGSVRQRFMPALGVQLTDVQLSNARREFAEYCNRLGQAWIDLTGVCKIEAEASLWEGIEQIPQL